MARSLRIEFPGAVYHVTSRGNGRQKVFLEDRDRELFLGKLAEARERYGFLFHAYCLMGNHFHLLVETPKPNLSLGMQRINGEYTQAFNRSHRRVGHLFQGRFKAVLVEKERHLLELCRYVVLNPVRARLANRPQEWRWSSYRATAGLEVRPTFLVTEWVLARFGTRDDMAHRRYARFVADGLRGDRDRLAQVTGQIVLGSPEFVARHRGKIEAKHDKKEHPRMQRLVGRPTLAELFEGICREKRAERTTLSERAREAHITHGYTLKAIADHLGVHYATAGRLVKAAIRQTD